MPDEVVIGIIRERLAEPDTAAGFMLDGFPRTLAQARRSTRCSPAPAARSRLVLLIDVPEEELVQRLAGRRACRACGRGYNVVFDPPKVDGVCDVCGGELFQRDDDNEDDRAQPSRTSTARRPSRSSATTATRASSRPSTAAGAAPDQVFAEVEQCSLARQADAA